MEKFINNLFNGNIETWILLFLFFIVVVNIIFKLLNTKGLKKIKTKFGEISFSNDDSPHLSCPYVKDIIIVLDEYEKLTGPYYEIKYRFKKDDLMRIAKDIVDEIIGDYLEELNRFLDKKNIHKEDRENSYNVFEMALHMGKEKALNYVEEWIDKNSFTEKEAMGMWEEYKKMKCEKLVDIFNSELDRRYKYSHPELSEISAYMQDVFFDANKKDKYIIDKINQGFDLKLKTIKSHNERMQQIDDLIKIMKQKFVN